MQESLYGLQLSGRLVFLAPPVSFCKALTPNYFNTAYKSIMGQICLILQGVVVGQWLLLTYRQSSLASPGNEKQCILPLPLSFF